MHELNLNFDLRQDNNSIATENRKIFSEKRIYVLNLMSAPGAGKTTLLLSSIEELKKEFKIGVIVGDIQSTVDCDRILKTGVNAIQIETFGSCHLDARMIHNNIHRLNLDEIEILLIENVGNLVCPAEFDLGENDKVMILSVSEGDDKPIKYPVMFHNSKVLIINKIDLLPYFNFDIKKVSLDAKKLNYDIKIFPLSAKTKEGMEEWILWLKERVKFLRM